MTRQDYTLQFQSKKMIDYYNSIISFKQEHFIPAVRFDSAMFLSQMAMIRQPNSVLEIGFGSGASTLFIRDGARMLRDNVRIVSLERDKNRFVRGQMLLKEFDVREVDLIHCDAFDYLRECSETFDFIFLDAVKRDYIDYLPLISRVVNVGGVLIVDNTFFNDKVLLDSDILEQKYQNGVRLLNEFNRALATDEAFSTQMYSIGDGMSLAIRVR